MGRRKKLGILALVAVVIIFCYLILIVPTILGFFEVGNGHFVIIHAAVAWEMNRPVHVEIREGLRVVSSCLVEFDLPGDPHEFRIVTARERSVVGLLDLYYGATLIAMHDFDTDSSWPCKATTEQRNALFRQLQSENPHLEKPTYWDR